VASFDEADIRAALRAKAIRLYALCIGITAVLTLAFTFAW
jgi:hypothetical protein